MQPLHSTRGVESWTRQLNSGPVSPHKRLISSRVSAQRRVAMYEAGLCETLCRVCEESGLSPNPRVRDSLHCLDRDQITGRSSPSGLLDLSGGFRPDGLEASVPTRVSDGDVLALCRVFACLPGRVDGLNLRCNLIADDGAEAIASLLQEESCWLTSLDLSLNDIGPRGARALGQVLQTNRSLMSLNLAGNKVGEEGGVSLATALQTNVGLRSLDLHHCDLGTDSIIAFSTALSYNSSVEELNLSRPLLFSLQEETTVHVARMLRANRALRTLRLAKHGVRDFGARRLSEALASNSSLTHLDLSCNLMARDGAASLALLLKQGSSLRVLDLGFNRIGDAGVTALARAVGSSGRSPLHTLVLVSNGATGEGLRELAVAMTTNRTLRSVHIWGNKLDRVACQVFAELLKSGRLKERHADVSAYEVDGRPYLAQLQVKSPLLRIEVATSSPTSPPSSPPSSPSASPPPSPLASSLDEW
uniref:Leucine-rich repeat-containing protein 34-like isoform X1 n=2 Tax=Petromyzon marinus TaxID=7757 RepID=A0AAJ7SL01_PETMA|nr:leucine-rich repeat-containing protein 34-like isoform X1 [Petromyzon marinus]